tara:strand:+ start:841 stop:1365 length:525 start_codon:yes stop_codon:yes gene_type:complete
MACNDPQKIEVSITTGSCTVATTLEGQTCSVSTVQSGVTAIVGAGGPQGPRGEKGEIGTVNYSGISGGLGIYLNKPNDYTVIINSNAGSGLQNSSSGIHVGQGSGITVTEDHVHVAKSIIPNHNLMTSGTVPTGIYSSGCFGQIAVDPNGQYLYVCIAGCGPTAIWRRSAISEW